MCCWLTGFVERSRREETSRDVVDHRRVAGCRSRGGGHDLLLRVAAAARAASGHQGDGQPSGVCRPHSATSLKSSADTQPGPDSRACLDDASDDGPGHQFTHENQVRQHAHPDEGNGQTDEEAGAGRPCVPSLRALG